MMTLKPSKDGLKKLCIKIKLKHQPKTKKVGVLIP